jgi:hypothetical protein
VRSELCSALSVSGLGSTLIRASRSLYEDSRLMSELTGHTPTGLVLTKVLDRDVWYRRGYSIYL